MLKIESILLIIAILVVGCKKEVFVNKEIEGIWEVETKDLQVQSNSVILNGFVVSMGITPTLGYGFAIRISDQKEQLVYMLEDGTKGAYSLSVPDTFKIGRTYKIRAFIETETEFFYGEDKVLVGSEKRPQIENFYPRECASGDIVKIEGRNFGGKNFNSKILIGDLNVEIIDWTDSQILVEIPKYKTADSCLLYFKQDDVMYSTDGYLRLYGPRISKIYPVEGFGQYLNITIHGNDFNELPHHNIVKLGEQQAKVIRASKEELLIEVDTREIPPGYQNLMVNTNEISTVNTTFFNVTSPWKKLTDYPGSGLSDATSFTIDNKVYICTGTIPGDYSIGSNQLWEYNIKNNTWTRKKDLPSFGRYGAIAFSIGQKGYVGTGHLLSPDQSGPVNDFWEYDSLNDSWKQIAVLPSTARQKANAFSFNGKGYVGMGHEMYGYNLFSDWWSYEPETNSWVQLESFPGHRREFAHTFVFNGCLYLFGGTNSRQLFEPDLWKYSFENDTWTFVDYIKFNPSAIITGENKCYAVWYFYYGDYKLVRLYEYDVEQNQFDLTYSFPGDYRTYGAVGQILANSLFFGLGYSINTYTYMNDFWTFPIN